MPDETETLKELFEIIETKIGAYSRDYLTYAENTINDMSKAGKRIKQILIKTIKHMIREAENSEITDVKCGLYSLIEELGVKVERDGFGDPYIEEESP